MTYTYRLPWPPSVNVYWRTGTTSKHGVPMTYLSRKAKEFRATVVREIQQQDGPQPETLFGRLMVSLELIPPTRRKLDIDNFCKSTLDALMHAGVFADDEQIDELRIRRLHVEPPGACDVTITELEPLSANARAVT